MTRDGAGRVRLPPDELLRRVTDVAELLQRSSTTEERRVDTADADLLAACIAACAVAARKLALFTGAGAVADDSARDVLLADLDAEERVFLDAAATITPVTWSGHSIRARTFLLWDAGCVYAEAGHGSAGERLLVAILHDLATS